MNRDEKERRRLQATPDLVSKVSGQVLADRYHVSRTTVSRWRRAVAAGKSLTSSRASGRPSRIDPDELRSIFAKHPCDFGIPKEKWTCVDMAAAIHHATGIRYDPDHVSRLLRKYASWWATVPARAVSVEEFAGIDASL